MVLDDPTSGIVAVLNVPILGLGIEVASQDDIWEVYDLLQLWVECSVQCGGGVVWWYVYVDDSDM